MKKESDGETLVSFQHGFPGPNLHTFCHVGVLSIRSLLKYGQKLFPPKDHDILRVKE